MEYKGRLILRDLILISLLAGLGIATKQIVAPMVMIVSSPLYIPAGTLAGGIYMMWPVLARGIVRKPGAGLLCTIIQSLVVFLSPFGMHGALTFPVYIAPGVVIEIIFVAFLFRRPNLLVTVLAGLGANAAGSLMVAYLILGIRDHVLVLILAASAASGIVGGVLAYGITREIGRVFPAYGDKSDPVDADPGVKPVNVDVFRQNP